MLWWFALERQGVRAAVSSLTTKAAGVCVFLSLGFDHHSCQSCSLDVATPIASSFFEGYFAVAVHFMLRYPGVLCNESTRHILVEEDGNDQKDLFDGAGKKKRFQSRDDSVTHIVAENNSYLEVLDWLRGQAVGDSSRFELLDISWFTACMEAGRPVDSEMKYRLMEQGQSPPLNTPESEVPSFVASEVPQYSCQRKTTLNNYNKKFTKKLIMGEGNGSVVLRLIANATERYSALAVTHGVSKDYFVSSNGTTLTILLKRAG
ncbi:dna nucleotidylexotransferase [Limosa lapponica baueri]|uniref:Dna nucleotidylexotransferase n=1 Tax=Limosa lapponica baueri TaxID=1758121 RepID=A0A2I0U4M3_LIMLA|nr:dna nucleotidylexotransferase [Limosa lapponica baueri]